MSLLQACQRNTSSKLPSKVFLFGYTDCQYQIRWSSQDRPPNFSKNFEYSVNGPNDNYGFGHWKFLTKSNPADG